MSAIDRAEIVTSLYRLQGDLAVLTARCADSQALVYGEKVQRALDAINEAIEETHPDPLPCQAMEFPRSKF